MNKFPVTKKRFVVYFDLMGFKDLVYRNSHREIKKIMDYVCDITNLIKEAEVEILGLSQAGQTDFEKTVILPTVFSDSILFVTKGETFHDAKKAFYVASFFLYKLAIKNIPAKGAIAFGTFTADFERSSFFGRPLIDAYLLANETYFYGATLHHTVD